MKDNTSDCWVVIMEDCFSGFIRCCGVYENLNDARAALKELEAKEGDDYGTIDFSIEPALYHKETK